jgi:hypothetical protein
MLVPKAKEGECLQWWQPPTEEKFKREGPIIRPGPGSEASAGNSSWDTDFSLNEAESGSERATNVSVHAPFRPFPLFQEGGVREAETCSTAVTITANSVARGYLP